MRTLDTALPDTPAHQYGELRERVRLADATPTPLALQVEFAEVNEGWGYAHTTRTAAFVRIVKPGKKKGWISSGLRFGTFEDRIHHTPGYDPPVLLALASFSRSRSSHSYYAELKAELDNFAGPMFWPGIDSLRSLGVGFLDKSGADLHFATSAEITATVTSDPPSRASKTADDGAGLSIALAVTIDGEEVDTHQVARVGSTALIAEVQQFTGVVTVIAPLARPVADGIVNLVGAAPLHIPAQEKAAFVADYLLDLARSVTVTSPDGCVEVPNLPRPTLVATLNTRLTSANIEWAWEGGVGDSKAVTEVAQVFEPIRSFGPHRRLPSGPLTGRQLIDVVADALPRLQEVKDLRVDVVGTLPEFRELPGEMQLTVTATESEENDWLDLGIVVRVGDVEVPFRPLFEALAAGERILFLDDGTYLRLDHPALQRLSDLIEEARRLSDKPGVPRLTRYQTSLWSELEEVADVAHASQAWRDMAARLAALTDDGAVPVEVPTPPGLSADLRGYQRHGLAWLAFCYAHGLGGILADDMGLGKTLEALALIAHTRQTTNDGERRPWLVVTPSSVVATWLGEASKFASELEVRALTATRAKSGVPMEEMVEGADVLVTSYGLLRIDEEEFLGRDWAGLILDEAQFAKNRATKANQLARKVKAPFKLAMTGTPMENSLTELWALLAITSPGLFPSGERFKENYIKPITGKDEVSRGLALERLRRRLRPLMMRRTKEAVAPELPPRTEQDVEIELEGRHRRVYDTFLQRERKRLLGLLDDYDANRFAIFRSLTTMRRMALDAALVDDDYAGTPSSKLDVLFELLEDVIGAGHRALVFSQFTTYLKKVAERCEAAGLEYAYLDGSTPGTRRPEIISGFRQGKAPLFLISLKAGGFGLTLTEADYVFLLDPWWNPAVENQAIDRTHRIGQDKPVMVMRLVAKDTIEEKVMALKARKAALFDAVLDDDGTFSTALTADDIRGLLEG